MQISAVHTGLFKLDGGAMFGVVPKSLWQKHKTPDANNMCTWAMRCLLIEDDKRLILVDNGIGEKQDEKFFSNYFLHGDYELHASLASLGVTADDITDVLLTHLHFDHCGGSVRWNRDRTGFEMTFKNAKYWSNESHWKWATEPNPREKASFLKDNILPIQQSGQLHFLGNNEKFSSSVEIIHSSGHTDHMMLPLIQKGNRKILFCADLIPSMAHLGLPWVMAYDTRPLLTMEEKEYVLNRAVEENWVLCFEHDHEVECVTLQKTEKGIKVDQQLLLSEI